MEKVAVGCHNTFERVAWYDVLELGTILYLGLLLITMAFCYSVHTTSL